MQDYCNRRITGRIWSMDKEEKVKETDCCNPNTEYGKYKLKLYQDALKICEEKGVRLIEPRFLVYMVRMISQVR